MSPSDYFNGLANTQYPADSFITHCLILCFLLLCALPLINFKTSIQPTFVYIENIIKHTYIYIVYIFETSYGLYILWKELKQLQFQDQHHKKFKTGNSLVQTLPPHEELITEVREQLIQPPFMEQIPSLQDSQQDFQVFNTEYSLNLHIPNVSIERTYSPSVVYNDRTFTEFVNGEERCLKFVNQDLMFLQASDISPVPTEVKESTHIRLPTHISTEDNNTSHTQIVEPALGFTPAEICHTQNEPKLTVQQLLEIDSCKDYVKTPLQTLDGIYVNQPKRFLPLAKEVKKLAEEFQKEEIMSQWAGLPPEKLLQESFMEQLDALQSLDQLALLTATKEHLPTDIINILELLGKADNTPFNQLYNLAEDCADRYYMKVIKTLTCLLKNSFHDRQLVLVNSARVLKFLELYAAQQAKLWKVLSKFHSLPDHFHDLKTTLQAEFDLLKKATSKKCTKHPKKQSSHNRHTPLPFAAILIHFIPSWHNLTSRFRYNVYTHFPSWM